MKQKKKGKAKIKNRKNLNLGGGVIKASKSSKNKLRYEGTFPKDIEAGEEVYILQKKELTQFGQYLLKRIRNKGVPMDEDLASCFCDYLELPLKNRDFQCFYLNPEVLVGDKGEIFIRYITARRSIEEGDLNHIVRKVRYDAVEDPVIERDDVRRILEKRLDSDLGEFSEQIKGRTISFDGKEFYFDGENLYSTDDGGTEYVGEDEENSDDEDENETP